jgi:hypothetical protein
MDAKDIVKERKENRKTAWKERTMMKVKFNFFVYLFLLCK